MLGSRHPLTAQMKKGGALLRLLTIQISNHVLRSAQITSLLVLSQQFCRYVNQRLIQKTLFGLLTMLRCLRAQVQLRVQTRQLRHLLVE